MLVLMLDVGSLRGSLACHSPYRYKSFCAARAKMTHKHQNWALPPAHLSYFTDGFAF